MGGIIPLTHPKGFELELKDMKVKLIEIGRQNVTKTIEVEEENMLLMIEREASKHLLSSCVEAYPNGTI